MSTKRYKGLLGLALAIAAVISVAHYAYGQGRREPDAMMPGMDMPESTNAPTADAAGPAGYAAINLTPEVQQRIGVTLGSVEQMPLSMTIRTVGIVRPDETKVAHVHLKTEGWVDALFVSFTGQKIKAGDPMLSIYSPAFYAAQREFLSALRVAQSSLNGAGDQHTVVETARQRLELWDIPKDAIDALAKSGKPSKSLILRSPISGTILEKNVFNGQSVMAQNELYVVADLSTVWMQAKIFEYELPHIEVGMPATVSISSLPTRQFSGSVVFIDPVVDEVSRSVQVRVELANRDGQLKPGMFGSIVITHAMGSGLTVPASAILQSGERDIVFRAAAAGRFVPVQVKVGPLRFGDRFQVLEGLKAGDQVAASGNFLIDSESRLEAGGGGMASMPGMGPAATKTASDKQPSMKQDDMSGMSNMSGAADRSKAQP